MWDIGVSFITGRVETSIYHNRFFEGKSDGLHLRNGTDGLTGLAFDIDHARRLVPNRVVLERIISVYQSGPYHDLGEFGFPDVGLGGQDNIYQNSAYKSGWTHYGNIVGMPLFLTNGKDGEDLRIGSNRIDASHLGIGGLIARGWSYRFMWTSVAHRPGEGYTLDPIVDGNKSKWQYDLFLEIAAVDPFDTSGFGFTVGVGATFGQVFDPSYGALVTMTWRFGESE
jgi:hypothetical protein